MNGKIVVINGIENTIHTPNEPQPKALEHLYDICNKLFKDKSNCFYTHDEVEQMRKDKTKIFLT